MHFFVGVFIGLAMLFCISEVNVIRDKLDLTFGAVNIGLNRTSDQEERIENKLDTLLKRLDKPADSSLMLSATTPIYAQPAPVPTPKPAPRKRYRWPFVKAEKDAK